MSGGSRVVNLGSQRVARAVVSWFATVNGDDGRTGFSLKADAREDDVEEAVVNEGEDCASKEEVERALVFL